MPRGLSNRSNWCFVNAILQENTDYVPVITPINPIILCPLPFTLLFLFFRAASKIMLLYLVSINFKMRNKRLLQNIFTFWTSAIEGDIYSGRQFPIRSFKFFLIHLFDTKDILRLFTERTNEWGRHAASDFLFFSKWLSQNGFASVPCTCKRLVSTCLTAFPSYLQTLLYLMSGCLLIKVILFLNNSNLGRTAFFS